MSREDIVELPRKGRGLPQGITEEKPASGLASLTMTEPLKAVASAIIEQWTALDAFRPLARYGIYPIRQSLFYGPPGNGKTTACQWIAKKLSVPLYRVCCEEVVGSYLGQTAQRIRMLLDWLEEQPACVVLLDEVESMFPSRDIAGTGSCAREIVAAMQVFWQRLDRWSAPQLFVFATNMAQRLDPALFSRIELKLEFGPPTAEQCRDVINYWAETLHEYGAEVWAPELLKRADVDVDGEKPFESFRALWQAIKINVAQFVLQGAPA